MDFNEFKEIMSELEEKGYVTKKEYTHHIFIQIEPQENIENRKLIRNKIEKIWDKVEGIGDYIKEQNYQLVFVKMDELIESLKEENYEKIKKEIDKKEISYIDYSRVQGKGTQKYIRIYTDNHYGIPRDRYSNEPSFASDIKLIIKTSLPSDMKAMDNGGLDMDIQTQKGTAWEEKRKCCEEIKIIDDFEEILSKY